MIPDPGSSNFRQEPAGKSLVPARNDRIGKQEYGARILSQGDSILQ